MCTRTYVFGRSMTLQKLSQVPLLCPTTFFQSRLRRHSGFIEMNEGGAVFFPHGAVVRLILFISPLSEPTGTETLSRDLHQRCIHTLAYIFPLTFDPSVPRNSGSAANVHSAPLSPTCQERGHKHRSLLPSVIEKLSQRSCDVFTLAADLCGRAHAMSRQTVSNLNTTLPVWLALAHVWGECLPCAHQSDWSQAKQSPRLCQANAGSEPRRCLDGRPTCS